MKMKFLKFAVPFVAVINLVLANHAQSSSDETTMQEIKQETQDLIDALKSYGAAQRDEAVQKADETLAKLDQRIEDLETSIDNNWDKMDRAAREKARASLKALRKQRIELAESFGSWKDSSTDAWEHMKEGFSDAYQALVQAWEKAEKEYSTEN